ncbi:MAG: FAD-dependent oxidoreductase [Spirochaetota bacterium]
MKQVIIVGGGVAGLSVASYLAYYRKFAVTLIDRNSYHLNQLRLHQSFTKEFTEFLYPFQKIARIYGIKFVQGDIVIPPESVVGFAKKQQISVNGKSIHFDFLVLATGAKEFVLGAGDVADSKILGLSDFQTERGMEKFRQLISRKSGTLQIHFLGTGPTSIQFLFELKEYLQRAEREFSITLLGMEKEVLASMPEAIQQYVKQKLQEEGIRYLPQTQFLKETPGGLRVKNLVSQQESDLQSSLIFSFPGVRSYPFILQTNKFGQVEQDNTIHSNIYSAGDCSRFSGSGLNSLTAQAAVRKGRIIGNNIRTHLYRAKVKPYSYQALGYFVNLGCKDAVGWAFSENTLLTGYPAIAMKEGIDLQLEGMLKGFNTYVDYS